MNYEMSSGWDNDILICSLVRFQSQEIRFAALCMKKIDQEFGSFSNSHDNSLESMGHIDEVFVFPIDTPFSSLCIYACTSNFY